MPRPLTSDAVHGMTNGRKHFSMIRSFHLADFLTLANGACGVAAVAFMSDKMVDLKNVNGKMVQIVRITGLAAFDGRNWSRIPVMTQYALIEPEGHTI